MYQVWQDFTSDVISKYQNTWGHLFLTQSFCCCGNNVFICATYMSLSCGGSLDESWSEVDHRTWSQSWLHSTTSHVARASHTIGIWLNEWLKRQCSFIYFQSAKLTLNKCLASKMQFLVILVVLLKFSLHSVYYSSHTLLDCCEILTESNKISGIWRPSGFCKDSSDQRTCRRKFLS